ncbi:MAG: hypothetical protein ACLRZG_06990 [Streptococcus sp.]
MIDNNSNNGVDKIFQYGDYNHMRHASGDEGWNFSVVTQTLTPGIWNKILKFGVGILSFQKQSRIQTTRPSLSVWTKVLLLLWKLWAHALGR